MKTTNNFSELPEALQQWRDDLVRNFRKISYLNGHRFRLAVIAAARQLIANQDYLNKINVFPVPDGDTGTNMASTLHSIIVTLKTADQNDISFISHAVSDSALDGARGNSGVILAQFFYGLAMKFEGKKQVDTKAFAEAVVIAKEQSYTAMSDPCEGTILSVIAEFSDTWNELSQESDDYVHIMEISQKRCQEELERSPLKLKVLQNSKVVDSGAQGFVNMLEGINEFIQGGRIREMLTDFQEWVQPIRKAIDIAFDPDVKFRYCTECIVDGEHFNRDVIRNQLVKLGDSLILAGSDTRLKLHIHTNEPEEVFTILSAYGKLRHKKADDMKKQVMQRGRKEHSIALVVDSTSDLNDDMLQDNAINVVPVRLSFGNENFIDHVTISPVEFYHKLKTSSDHPKTSQPAPRDFSNMYRYLISHFNEIISIHVTRSLSGTWQSAANAASQIDKKNIHIIDSKSASLGVGILALKAAQYVKAGIPAKKIVEKLELLRETNRIYIMFDTLDYVIKGGRLNPRIGKILTKIGLMPLITFDRKGNLSKSGFIRRGPVSWPKIVARIQKEFSGSMITDIGVIHANVPEMAERFEKYLRGYFPDVTYHTGIIGPALGCYTGPGTLGIVVFKSDL